MLPELAPRYYLDNFNKLIDHTQEWYADFLNQEEQAWLTCYNHLELNAQCLLVRLYSRKSELFRQDKLSYPEIGDLTAPLTQLAQEKLIQLNPLITDQSVARSLLTKPEMLRLYPHLDKSAKKQHLIDELDNSQPFCYSKVEFNIIQLKSAHIIKLLLGLFFGNTHQDLSQFVLDDLGIHQFEPYPLSLERRFFASREQIDQLLKLNQLTEQYDATDRKQSEQLRQLTRLIPSATQHNYIDKKRALLINNIARDFERLQDYSSALELFQQTTLPPSRERQARIYDKLDELDLMRDIVTEIVSKPNDVAEYEIGLKLELRLRRKRGERITRQQKPSPASTTLSLDLSTQRVELAVKHHLEAQGWVVFFSENALLNGLFGLAFWEVIFAPVEGAFMNAYQHRPLDLYQSSFTSRREMLIRQRFEQLTRDGFDSLLTTYHKKSGIVNPFIQWQHLTLPLITHALTAFSPDILISLFDVLLRDLKLYRNGMPDLIAFKKEQYQWVEVKGPGDKLQDNQLRWIKEFERLNVNMSVCYVTDDKA